MKPFLNTILTKHHVVGYTFIASQKTVKSCSSSFDQYVSSTFIASQKTVKSCSSFSINM